MNDILVVDDEQDVIDMLRRNLELEGFEVEGATQHDEAVELMEENLYPVVILDIKFPDTSGPQLLEEFKEINPLVNVVMITGYSSMENVVECLGGGAVDYFVKPLQMDEFIEAMKNIDSKVDRWRESIGMS